VIVGFIMRVCDLIRVSRLARGRDGLICFLLGVTAFLVFLPAVRCAFVNWDDNSYVYDNPLVLNGLSIRGIQRAFTDVVFCNWAPLTILSYQLDATLFGREPWGFHLTNVLYHAVAVAVLYIALQRMTGSPGRSAVAALFFALHPLRVESVAWIAERKDVLSVLFLFLAMLAYDGYCRRPGPWRYGLICAAMLASLLSKATAVTLPVLLLLLDVWPLGRLTIPGVDRPVRGDGAVSPYPSRPWKAVMAEKLPLFALALVFAVVTLETQSTAIQSEGDMPFWTARLPNAIHATTWYIMKTFWPSGLHPVCEHTGVAGRPLWLVLGCTTACASLATLAAVSIRRLPAVTIGIAWFAISLLPMLGLVAQQGFQAYADRFTYVPHVGLVVAIVWALASWADRLRTPIRARTIAVGLVSLALAAVTSQQITNWRNSETLWRHALAVDPGNGMAHTKLGNTLLVAGDIAAAKRHYIAALECSGGAANVLCRLAGVQFDLGEFDEARKLRDRAIAIDPDGEYTTWIVKKMRVGPPQPVSQEVKAAIRHGLTEARAGHMGPALTSFERAVELDPACADAHNNVGMALVQLGQAAEAAEAFERAVAINPVHADYRLNLARSLLRLNRVQDAFRHCRAAMESDPTDAAIKDFHDALNHAGAGQP